MTLLELRKKLESRKNQIGLIGIRLDLSESPGNSVSAALTSDWKIISIKYGKNLDLVPDSETLRYVRKRDIDDPKLKLSLDLLEHESSHRENPSGTRFGCPYTVEMHDIIKEAIHKVLSVKGKAGLEDYVTNAFEDILDNVNCRKHTDFAGQALFWNNQGLVNSKNEKYSPFYEAFVQINLVLGGSVKEYTLLRRFYTNDRKVKKATKGFLDDMRSILGVEKLVRIHEKPAFKTIFTRDLQQREKLWTDLAHSFAMHTADLLEQMPPEMMFGSSENPFDKEMRQPRVKQEIAFNRYKRGKGPAGHRDLQEQLYDLYKRISKEIRVETSFYSESQKIPPVHYGKRFIKKDEQKFRYKGIGFKQDGSIGLRTTRYSELYPVSYKVHLSKFPKFKLILIDRSSSMKYNCDNESDVGDKSFIPWGDKSKYHFALKGYFGIDNFLERQGISNYVQNCVLGFSGENAIRGKSKKVAKALLTMPSGGTSFDIDRLESELSDENFVLSISDGEFELTEDIKKRLEQKIKQVKVDYAHIQIGEDTDFSSYLKKIDVPVFKVRGDDDLAKTMISFVSSYYRRIEVCK
ncbi:hypothetical protein DRJ17_04220 [Candidatus Woesearchaeota archaeon]|nr:MAG: hypothetical protein DRJ17_04220 [Candidatus Woesearchaeota archaeon]